MANRDSYRIGWICALPVEMAAAQAMLDELHPALPNRKNDQNKYVMGSIGPHNIVITCLPAGVYGTTSATATVLQMRYSYESLEACLMVGIGGGVPVDHDIRLGDIVVSEPTIRYGGVMQYDRGKAVDGGRTTPTGVLDKPPEFLLKALLCLKAKHMLGGSDILRFYEEALRKYPYLIALAQHPGRNADQLFVAEYSHVLSEPSCRSCDLSMLRQRLPRPDGQPRIFYGLIASGNKVIKDAKVRDQLAKEYGILCFETEAAGIMDIFPCLVIRGVCDYADSHKNKGWQGYAAVMAAAYTKELLLYLPSYEMTDTRKLPEELTVNPQLLKTKTPALPDPDSALSPSAANYVAPRPRQDNDSEIAPEIPTETVQAAVMVDAGPVSQNDSELDMSRTVRQDKLENAVSRPEDASPGLNHILATLVSRIDSQQIFQTNLSMARRRNSWHSWPGDCAGVFESLKHWVSSPGSSGLMVFEARGPSTMRVHARITEFAAEVVHFLLQFKKAYRDQTPDYQVLYALYSSDPASRNPVEVLKSIFQQAMQLYPEVLLPHLTASVADTFEELELWTIFRHFFAQAPRVFVIIQAGHIAHDFTSKLFNVANDIISDPESQVKFLITANGQKDRGLGSGSPGWSLAHIPPEPPQSAQVRSRPLAFVGWHNLSPQFRGTG